MNYAHFGVWNADGVCCSGLDAQTAPRKLGEILKWVNGFLNQAEADMRNRGAQAMLCPCIDCLNQKKFAQREIIFHHLVTCQKITRVGINMVRKALINSKGAA
jgi:hypothetical protein